jgi:cytochrome c-type biogenesis protein
MKKTVYIIIALMLALAVVAEIQFPPGAQKTLEYEKNIGLAVTLLIAFLGGMLTFTSPCGFVVLPTFFAYLFKERKRALFMTATFSLGMTIAFIIFGFVAGIAGNFFNVYKEFFATISGILLIIFGFMLMFNQGFSLFDFRVKHAPDHGWGVLMLGFFFAIGWTPCVGPILAGIVVLSTTAGTILKSVLLFTVYALGVAVPLMIVSYFSDRYDVAKWFTSKHIEIKLFGQKIQTHLYAIIGGILLIILGLIMMLDKGTRFFMKELPNYVPWTMTFFTEINEKLVQSSFFTSTTANMIGAIIAFAIIYVMWKAIFHHKKEYK